MFDGPEKFEGEKKIAEMLSSLNRVEAPGDFNTEVRARIARGAAVSTTSWTANLVRAGAFAAVAVVIAVGGYFALTSINTGQDNAPSVAETRPEPQDPIVELASSDIGTSQSANRTKPNDELVAENNNPAPTNHNAKPNGPNSTEDRPSGGSTEIAVRESQNLFPRGVDPNAKVPANAKGVDPSTRIPVSSIFDFIGIKATWTGDGWRVDSVEATNIASRSGIRNGDVVEEINGQSVDSKTTFPARFEGKSVRIRRDGASISIDFKP